LKYGIHIYLYLNSIPSDIIDNFDKIAAKNPSVKLFGIVAGTKSYHVTAMISSKRDDNSGICMILDSIGNPINMGKLHSTDKVQLHFSIDKRQGDDHSCYVDVMVTLRNSLYHLSRELEANPNFLDEYLKKCLVRFDPISKIHYIHAPPEWVYTSQILTFDLEAAGQTPCYIHSFSAKSGKRDHSHPLSIADHIEKHSISVTLTDRYEYCKDYETRQENGVPDTIVMKPRHKIWNDYYVHKILRVVANYQQMLQFIEERTLKKYFGEVIHNKLTKLINSQLNKPSVDDARNQRKVLENFLHDVSRNIRNELPHPVYLALGKMQTGYRYRLFDRQASLNVFNVANEVYEHTEGGKIDQPLTS